MAPYGLLHITDVQDIRGTVRTLLPSAGADEEDGDEGEQDEDDNCQFEQGHTGLGLHTRGVGKFHRMLFSNNLGVLQFCRIEKAWEGEEFCILPAPSAVLRKCYSSPSSFLFILALWKVSGVMTPWFIRRLRLLSHSIFPARRMTSSSEWAPPS